MNYLSQSGTNRSQTHQDNVIHALFGPGSPAFIGNLPAVEPVASGHSYFTTSPANRLKSVRQDLAAALQKEKVAFWQSEYCVLGDNDGEINGSGRDLGMTTALYVARVIHTDITLANATSWQWWLALSPSNYKDGLIYVENNGKMGENPANAQNGDIMTSKTLWALGNYARFVRPGMVRIALQTDSDTASDAPLLSAYRSEDGKQLVLVVVNPGPERPLQLDGLPASVKKVAIYETSATANLRKRTVTAKNLTLAAQSVTTITTSL